MLSMPKLLVIRKAQLLALGGPGRALFEQSLLDKARRFFPQHTAEMSDAELIQRLGYAMRRAADHGLSFKADVAKYVYLTLALGKDFDIDPSMPWASRILRSKGTPAIKFRRLYCEAIDQLENDRVFVPQLIDSIDEPDPDDPFTQARPDSEPPTTTTRRHLATAATTEDDD
jgi:hypothetical protein